MSDQQPEVDQQPDGVSETAAPDAVSERATDSATDPVTDPAAGSRGAAVSHASRHENPTDRAEALGAGLGDNATGDIVIDSALQDLRNAAPDDLDAQVEAGHRVQQTLQARLSDLGGE